VSALRQASCALAAERFMPGSIVWCVWFPASAFCCFSAKGRLDPPCVMYSNQKKKEITGLVYEKRVLEHVPLQG